MFLTTAGNQKKVVTVKSDCLILSNAMVNGPVSRGDAGGITLSCEFRRHRADSQLITRADIWPYRLSDVGSMSYILMIF